jgi:hypothetical protein
MLTGANKGRLATFLTGITGISAGGVAVVNIPVNARYHRILLQPSGGILYTGGLSASVQNGRNVNSAAHVGTGLPSQGTVGTGTVSVTVTAGIPTGFTMVVGTSSGYAVGDTLIVGDVSGGVGQGLVLVCNTAGGLTTANWSIYQTAGPLPPTAFFTSVKQIVNGVNMRDISPANILSICQMCGYVPQFGELPLLYTEPWRNVNHHNEVESWDVSGQQTFSLQLGIAGNVYSPGLSGIAEYDYQQNATRVKKGSATALVAFLQPVAQHQFTWPGVSGRNDVNMLPFSYPISRIWVVGGTPGQIYQLEVYQDGNKILEATTQQVQQLYAEYGFTFNIGPGQPTGTTSGYSPFPALPLGNTGQNIQIPVDGPAGLNQAWTVPNGPINANAFDTAFISDPDQRYFKALKCASSLNVRVYSNIAQTLTFVMETLPGAYQS